MLLYPNKGFWKQHSSATVREPAGKAGKTKLGCKMMILQGIEKVKMSSLFALELVLHLVSL